ncbi:MAG TPA: squalene/phytoene synthase family protein [Allosphingosinicella sp.]|nr:squalene/phytoene synthase family protein [Allosphingosinicella sp.]
MTLILDPDRQLALAYVPVAARPAVAALWQLDVSFASILVTGTQPMVSQLRLAWWREALERLDSAPAPAEPVLQALAARVLPVVSGAELAAMEEGWLILLSDAALTEDEMARYAALRGGLLFAYAARLLGDVAFPVTRAGEAWALADLARRSGRRNEVVAPAPESKSKWPKKLRPLGMLAALARRDLERLGRESEKQGSPGRMLRMVRHRISGY